MVYKKQSDRAKILRDELNRHNHAYFILGRTEISDGQYDLMMRELYQIEEEFPDLATPDSPTQRVGSNPADNFTEVTHLTPMLSLRNAFNTEEFLAWHSQVSSLLNQPNFDMVCELKYDGLAVSLTYEKGVFIKGATRGNGTVGEDITQNLRTIKSIPLRLLSNLVPPNFEVRGEVYFPKSEFAKLNKTRMDMGLTSYSNPRNTAAGSLRQLDSKITAQRPLSIFIYSLGYSTNETELPANHWDILRYLNSLGFRINQNNKLAFKPKDALAFYHEWVTQLDNLDYDCDGVVVKVNRLDYQKQLGHVGRDPRWAVAYKFPATQSTTQLLDIKVNVGKTGSINPYAILEPINIGGVTVKQATLHNENYIRTMELMVGDWVVVERAGEVIPKIVSVVTSKRNGTERYFDMPDTCPSCETSIVHTPGEAMSYCNNASCSSQLARLLEHFISRDCMDINGMGGKLGNKLISYGLIKDVADIYYLNQQVLIPMPNMAEKRASNLINAIEDSKLKPLSKVISSLGINLVGSQVAETLTRTFNSMDELIEANEYDLTSIQGIGPKIAISIIEYFQNQDNYMIVRKLLNAGVGLISSTQNTSFRSVLDGLVFVITGKLENFSRSEIEKEISELGGSISSSVSKKTNYLIAGSDPGIKLNNAINLKVTILNENEFRELINRLENT